MDARRRFRSSISDEFKEPTEHLVTAFAKLAINEIGLGAILTMANDFGWNNQPIPADFYIPASPCNPPSPTNSSAHTVENCLGFGYVSVSAMHSAWQTMIIANDGSPKPLRLFEDSVMPICSDDSVLSKDQAIKIRHESYSSRWHSYFDLPKKVQKNAL